MGRISRSSSGRYAIFLATTAAAFFTSTVLVSGQAEEKQWWPFKVEDWTTENGVVTDYVPLTKAEKKWHVCIVVPHLKDSWWVAVDHGFAMEAERQGIKMTLYQAGGYTELSRQISQYDDCIALGADAIVVAAVSDSAMSRKIEEGKSKGIKQLACGNPIFEGPIDAQVYTPPAPVAFAAGEFVVDYFKDRDHVRTVSLPGPQGAGFAESAAQGFRDAIEGTNIELIDEKYGETGKSEQLKLIEDALQSYDTIDLLFGTAVMGEVAVGALTESGRTDDVEIVTWYSNQGMISGVLSGDILATVEQYPVAIGRVCIDLAVRVLEGKEHLKEVHMIPIVLTQDVLKSADLSLLFAPDDWQPVFSVD